MNALHSTFIDNGRTPITGDIQEEVSKEDEQEKIENVKPKMETRIQLRKSIYKMRQVIHFKPQGSEIFVDNQSMRRNQG